jgi:hypothetical protein
MKNYFLVLILLGGLRAYSQETNLASDHFVIEGKVANKTGFDFSNVKDFNLVMLDSFVIYNHLHEKKRTLKNIRGILLTDILRNAGIDETNPKLMSEFYYTCIARDGYKVVFSWNEIFNTDIGSHILVITEADGKMGMAMPDRILLLSAKDIATGRRFVKGLDKIIVERVK